MQYGSQHSPARELTSSYTSSPSVQAIIAQAMCALALCMIMRIHGYLVIRSERQHRCAALRLHGQLAARIARRTVGSSKSPLYLRCGKFIQLKVSGSQLLRSGVMAANFGGQTCSGCVGRSHQPHDSPYALAIHPAALSLPSIVSTYSQDLETILDRESVGDE